MGEIILAVSNCLLVIGILAYFYWKEVKNKEDGGKQTQIVYQFFKELNDSKDGVLKELSTSQSKVLETTSQAYLKHIASLEKIMAPKPQVIRENNHMESPNDIEKTEVEKDKEEFADIVSKLPIDQFTKVAFENDIVEDGVQKETILH